MAVVAYDGGRPGVHADQSNLASKLYIASLPNDIEEEEIRKVFGVYGAVTDVHVNRPTEGRLDRSAFVRFEEEAAACAAMLVLTDMYKFREDSHTAIVVQAARPAKGAKGGGDDWNANRGPKGGDRVDYTSMGNNATYNAAAPAVGGVTGGNGIVAYGAPPMGGASPPAPPAPYRGGAAGRDPNGKLWVGNLPVNVTDEMMETVFNTYGRVVEVNILPSKSKSGQRCAFVIYGTAQEADACLAAMASGYEMQPGTGELKVERPSGSKGGGYGGYGGAQKGGSKGYYGRPY